MGKKKTVELESLNRDWYVIRIEGVKVQMQSVAPDPSADESNEHIVKITLTKVD